MVEMLYVIPGLISIFVPGFLLGLLFYPGRGDLDFWERIGVSFGLGVLALVFISVILAQPGLKALTAGPFFGSVAALSAVCMIITYWRGSLKWVIALVRRPKPKQEAPGAEEPKPEPPEEVAPAEESTQEG
jgi:uncharacterized membrane protein